MRTSTIEEAVKNGNFVIHPKGVSMWPMIRSGKDSVVINPHKGRLKKYDIPLYKDHIDRYVVHRIIEVKDEGYVICGDGLFEIEYDITDEDIIGVVTGFFRKEKYIPVDDKRYVRYMHFWVDNFYLRKPVIKITRKLRYARYKVKELLYRIIKGKKTPEKVQEATRNSQK